MVPTVLFIVRANHSALFTISHLEICSLYFQTHTFMIRMAVKQSCNQASIYAERLRYTKNVAVSMPRQRQEYTLPLWSMRDPAGGRQYRHS